MREAAVPGYRLSRAKQSTRILITLGMFGLFLGLIFSIALTLSRTGIFPSDISVYYRGTETAEGSLDKMLQRSVPRPFAEIAEHTHNHIMGGSILLFLLCHLLALCDVKDSTRSTLYIVSFSSFLLTFGSPWLIIYLSPAFAYLYSISVSVLTLSLLLLCLIPIREMWFSD